MRRTQPFALFLSAVAGTLAASDAFAQSERVQGPLLVPPGPWSGTQQLRPQPDLSGTYTPGGAYSPTIRRPTIIERGPSYPGRGYPGRPVDRDIAETLEKAKVWHGNLFGTRASRDEVAEWEDHLRRGGSPSDILAEMLATNEYFERNGGTFDRWFTAAASAATVPISPRDVAYWRDVYRGDRDRLVVMQKFLATSGIFDGRRPHDDHDHGHEHGHGGGWSPGGYPGGYSGGYGPGYGSDYYALEPDRGHGPGAPIADGHGHVTAYNPAVPPAGSEAGMIAGWYRTYNGRDVRPEELDKWLSDRRRGVPLDEVYASVLGGGEWYARTGSADPQWVASTLEALGQPTDGGTVNLWLGRLRRHNGDKFGTALEMIRTAHGQPTVLDWRDDGRRRRDRRDNDDD